MTIVDYLSIIGIIIIDIISYRIVLKKTIDEFLKLNKLVVNGQVSTGEVIDVVEKSDLDGRTQYAPLIRYFANNVEYKFQSEDFSFNKPVVGAAINICYNSNDPLEVIDNPKTVLLFKGFIIIFILIVLTGLNFGILYKVFST
ncbi:DUF3592 domain-containing protein [Lacibacter sediminis]|uniref:DUF3592 domain-containing protein n=1 Tax=Lacibacter sediminis TaxID=2760713 RepID=A0A7G5XEK2_9BACT|nr:DUF3592 domain-containing protein [Lacibacter sediminis]QNA43905.1 hypothetical protein H4075_17790 [Lacibacter sediminis]